MVLNKKEKIYACIVLSILAMCIATCHQLSFGQSPPIAYYTFDNTNPLSPTIGNGNIVTAGTYTIGTNGMVGRYMDLSTINAAVQAGSYNIGGASAFTVQMLFKFHYNSMYGAFQPMFSYQSIDASFEFPNIGFKGFYVKLDGINRKSWQYYLDNQWHHAAFVYNKVTGSKKIYIDGLLSTGFTGSQGAGTPFATNTHPLYITPFTQAERMFKGYVDEFALYNVELTASQIYKNYKEATQGLHYTTTLWGNAVPTAPTNTGSLDMNSYAPGYPNVSATVYEQLTSYPAPRYNPLRPLKKNMSWFDNAYMLFNNGGYNWQMTTSQRNTLRGTQIELAKTYNMYLTASENTTVNADGRTWDTTYFRGALLKICNDNPTLPCAIKTFWAQVSTGKIGSQNNPINHYARSSGSQFTNLNGGVSTTRYRSNAAPNDSIVKDANTQAKYIDTILTYITRPINLWNENGEVIHRFSDAGITTDVAALNERNSLYPAFSLQQYQGKKFTISTNVYKNPSAIKPQLASTPFTSYAIDGQNEFRINYEFAREQMSTIDGRYYPTPDFYPRWPDNWISWYSAWHGWEWIVASRKNELALQDTFYSPYVAHGWDVPETGNIAPAQWLALMKTLVVSGAEYFYPSTFSNGTLPGNQYCWALIYPSYAQALASKISWYRQSTLLNGNMPRNFIGQISDPGYAFYTGDRNVLVNIRKNNTDAKYLIAACILPLSNQSGQVPNYKDVTLNGFNNIKIRALRQGATYVLDSTQSPPLFYQLDGWHETKHPGYWSADFAIEAELADVGGTNKTSGQIGTDYTAYQTYVKLSAGDTIKYYINIRTAGTYYFNIKARTTGTNTTVDVSTSGSDVGQISCINNTAFCWQKYDFCNPANPLIKTLPVGPTTIEIVAVDNQVEIDSIYISMVQQGNLLSCTIPCNGVSAAITPSGTTNLCTGGTQVYTASPGASYLWSNGATTQTITASIAGTYTCTVTDANSCTASASVTLTINAATPPTITPTGSTTFCSGASVILTSSVGNTYNWSNGATTQAITTGAAGTYTVTVSNLGCTATSAGTVVVVNTLPVVAIGKVPSTPVCIPTTVVLTASGGTTYLWNTGTTANSLFVTTAGTYTVTATNASGCTKSISENVIINTPSPAYLTPAGTTTICIGDTVTLTTNVGQSYLWSTGATTQAIRVHAYGQYGAFVTDFNGCASQTNTALIDTIQQNSQPATISPIASISCDSLMLQANIANGYMWSTGETTREIIGSPATTYTVTVTFDNTGCSSTCSYTYSGEISLLSPPTNLTNNEVAANYAYIQFSPVSNASFYRAEICDANKNRLYIVTLTANENNIYFIRLNRNTKYFWRVRSFCKDPIQRMSNWSDYLLIQTKAR